MEELVKNYGLVIVDECHHVAAYSFEKVLDSIRSKYVYGLTATPIRKDGWHRIAYMQCGDIRVRVSNRELKQNKEMEHIVIVKKTNYKYISMEDKIKIPEIYSDMCNNVFRNSMIIEDINKCVSEGRIPIILTERIEHLNILKEGLSKLKDVPIVVYKGSMGKKKSKEIQDIIIEADENNKTRIILATSSSIGEGFDDSRLDTLFLTMPVSWKGRIIQYGEKIYFFLERKNIKNMNLKVDKNKNVIVSIPKRMSVDRAKEFIKQKIKWIKKQQEYYEKMSAQKENLTFENGAKAYLYGKQYEINIISNTKNEVIINDNYIEIHVKEKYIQNKEYIQKVYENWLKNNAVKIFQELVLRYQQKLKESGYLIKISTIQIRKMKTRWGSCTPSKNKVVFNLNLIKTPMCCIEYVVLHELAHFKHQNHSKNFYNFIAMFMPDWKERRRILNKEFGHIV